MVVEIARRLDAATEALLGQLLQETFGRDAQLLRYQIANQHADYYVLLVTLQQPSVELVIKLAGPNAPFDFPFDRTARLLRLVAERTTVPIPEILAADGSYNRWPWRYLIQRRIQGQEWASLHSRLRRHELTDAHGQIGVAIAQLHAIIFPAFGEIAMDGTVQPARDVVLALANRASRTIRQGDLRQLFLTLLDQRSALFADVTAAALCHDDLHHHNILFHQQGNRWELAAILDFDKAWAGPAEADLARLELWQGMAGDDFWPAYRAVHAIAPRYAERRAIYQLLWCLEYAVGSPEHNAATERVCAELHIPPVRFG